MRRTTVLGALALLTLSASASGQPPVGEYGAREYGAPVPATPTLAQGSLAPQPPGALEAALADAERATEAHARVEAEVEGLVAQRQATSTRLRQRLRALYRLRRAGSLPLAGGFEALLRHQSRVQRLGRMVVRDVAAQRQLERRVAALGAETGRLGDAVEEAQRRARAAQQQAAHQQDSLAAIAALMADPTGAGGGASVQEAAAWSGSQTPGFGMRAAGSSGPGFLTRRGHLPLPVGGSASVAEGEREGGQGLELTAAPGVSVRAVAPGRVAYASRHPAYERLVIVDHGETFYSVYGGLSSLAVSPGAAVEANAPLGAVGGRPLFFQVRRGSRPLDTRAWLGI